MIEVKPLAGALGAEVHGIDLASLTDSDYQSVRKLLVKHEVIFFREQNIDHAAHAALAHAFGPVQTHPAYATVPGHPEITILESTPEKPTKIEAWHSDMTFRQRPPMATCLRARVIPERGGDTLWSSMTAAYEGLSRPMQQFLATLSAEHSFTQGFKESLAEPGGQERLAQAVADNPPVQHPVVCTHPESGRKVLYVNSLFTTHIIGLQRSESNALLAMLYDHVKTPEYTCRFNWRPDSLALWDNRSTQHKPINDYFPAHRMLERITIDGDQPYAAHG